MNRLGIFLIGLVSIILLGTTTQADSKYTVCHRCEKFRIDPEKLAQEAVKMRYRSTVIRGLNNYPGCKSYDGVYVCFISGYNLLCGTKRSLGVFTSDQTGSCTAFLK